MAPTYSLRTITDLGPGEHACCLYETEEEHCALITPFLRRGLEQGEKVLYISDDSTPDVVLSYLRNDGLNVEACLSNGQLGVLPFEDSSWAAESFDPDRTVAVLRSQTERALSEGYSALRITAEMSWALHPQPGNERLGEFESKLNAFFSGSQCLALCQYDRRRFDSVALLNALVTHPVAIVGTLVHDNFYYIPVSSYQGQGLPATALHFWLENLAGRKRAEEEIIRSRDFYLTLFDELPNPIRRTGVDGKSNYFNRSWLAFTGRPLEEEIGDGWTSGIHKEDSDRCLRSYQQAFKARKPYEIEYRLRHRGSEYRWIIEIGRPFNDLDGNFSGYIGSYYDITERKQHEQQLSYLATHDPLTGLPNRRSLEEALKRVVARARRGTASALLFLDVDNFKFVNDTLGHAAGDRTLVLLTRLLQGGLRTEDLVVRLGGDEFAVLLEGTGIEDAELVAERMRQAVEKFSFNLDGISFNLSLSIGLVAIDGQQTSVVDLSRADTAMYKAKEMGRNRVVLYRPGEEGLPQLSEANRLMVRLKDALKEGLFVLHYQPIVRLRDGQIEYYEALVRLREKNGDMLTAGEFISAAERFGLMPQLTRWVLREAIQTLHKHPEIRLSMNLSGLDLTDDALPEFTEARLRESNVEPGRLSFEITETAVTKDLLQAERWIQRLKLLGCPFALDDFGTGFVSFIYLRDLPIDQLKIAGSFIRTLETDPAQRAIVQAVQTLARTQGKEIVAEFVENQAVAEILRGIGVTYGQGYYLGKPHPELLRESTWLPSSS
ncbi:MAG: EAL domain-containing protein [Chloroflexi bacterium]|nr:EAL domain-containing protein [Chloroflexota bacterium]